MLLLKYQVLSYFKYFFDTPFELVPSAQVAFSYWIIWHWPNSLPAGRVPPQAWLQAILSGWLFWNGQMYPRYWQLVAAKADLTLSGAWHLLESQRGLCSTVLKGMHATSTEEAWFVVLFLETAEGAKPRSKSLLWISDHTFPMLGLDYPWDCGQQRRFIGPWISEVEETNQKQINDRITMESVH